jgi:uncharacterized coiled-coil protein SlyX
MSKPNGTRPPGRQPRHNPPRPPSTQPPSTAAGQQRRSHEVFVQIASLQMAKARQKRIRAALQGQIETCNEEIERIEEKIRGLYEEAGLEQRDEAADPSPPAPGDDGFEYEY